MNKSISRPTLTEAKTSEPSKIDNLQKQLVELAVRMLIELKPYEIKISRTKSQIEYYLPYQYEIVDNIEMYSNAYIATTTGLSIKSLYTSENNDAVFYLRSRGISERTARIMAAFKQTYFKVNMDEAINEYNKSFTITL